MTASSIVPRPTSRIVPEPNVPIKVSGVNVSPEGCHYLVVYKNDQPKPRWVHETEFHRYDLIRAFNEAVGLITAGGDILVI